MVGFLCVVFCELNLLYLLDMVFKLLRSHNEVLQGDGVGTIVQNVNNPKRD